MKSWKTTICGAIALAATCAISADFGPVVTKIAAFLASSAGGIGLLFSKDFNISGKPGDAQNTEPKT